MNSGVHTVELCDRQAMLMIPATNFWQEGPERYPEMGFGLTAKKNLISYSLSRTIQTVTAIMDPWREEESRGAVATVCTAANRMLVIDLGWSKEQALETRMRLRTFEEDWEAPGMEGYDDL